MMDFIMVPLVVGIVTLGIYKLFELFACRKERLAMIEKMGGTFDAKMLENKVLFKGNFSNYSPFWTLRIACLLLGVGLGLLVGFLIIQMNYIGYERLVENASNTYNAINRTIGIIYGASVLLFGGFGLLIAFIIEMRYVKKNVPENK